MRRVEDSPEIVEAKAAKEKWDHAWKAVMTAVIGLLTAAVVGATKTIVTKFEDITKQQAQNNTEILKHSYEMAALRSDVTVLQVKVEQAITRLEVMDILKKIEQRVDIVKLTKGPHQAAEVLKGAVKEEIEYQERKLRK